MMPEPAHPSPGDGSTPARPTIHAAPESYRGEPLAVTHCPSCDYSLTGLPDRGRCPECGELYDKAVPALRAWAIRRSPRSGVQLLESGGLRQWARSNLLPLLLVGTVLAGVTAHAARGRDYIVFIAATGALLAYATASAMRFVRFQNEPSRTLWLLPEGFAIVPRSMTGRWRHGLFDRPAVAVAFLATSVVLLLLFFSFLVHVLVYAAAMIAALFPAAVCFAAVVGASEHVLVTLPSGKRVRARKWSSVERYELEGVRHPGRWAISFVRPRTFVRGSLPNEDVLVELQLGEMTRLATLLKQYVYDRPSNPM